MVVATRNKKREESHEDPIISIEKDDSQNVRWKGYIERIFSRSRKNIYADYDSDLTPSFVLNLSSVHKTVPELFDLLVQQPLRTMKKIRSLLEQEMRNRDLPDISNLITIKFVSFSSVLKIHDNFSDLSSKKLYNLMAVVGIVRSASPVRPFQKRSEYECTNCQAHVMMVQEDPVNIKFPDTCMECGKSKKFREIEISENTNHEFVDSEIFEIEERSSRSGRTVVQKCHCIAQGSLVSEIVPGEEIVIVGVLRHFRPLGSSILKSQEIYIDVCGFHREKKLFSIESELDRYQRKEIQNLVDLPGFQDKLIESLCPNISGMYDVKLGMLIVLLGGSKLNRKFRSDIHMLIAGDPGLAKTQILQYARQIVPHAVYASGKSASGAGLTASVVQSELGGGWAIQAGAMVIANGSICCIDEMDKMSSSDRSSIHEGMESQTISIAKAGLTATLKCEAGILAAANPKYSRFDQNLPLDTQIDLSPTLMSRFDLIFVLLDHDKDIEEEDITNRIYENISRSYSYLEKTVSQNDTSANGHTEPLIEEMEYDQYLEHSRSEFKKLIARSSIENRFPQGFVVLFLGFARRLKPHISHEVYDHIRHNYLRLRKESLRLSKIGQVESRVTVRVLESIIRVSEAFAKIRFSPQVSLADIDQATRLVSKYFIRSGYRLSKDQEQYTTSIHDVPEKPAIRSYNDEERVQALFQIISTETEKQGGIQMSDLIEIATQNESFGKIPDRKIEQLVKSLRGFSRESRYELVLQDAENKLYITSNKSKFLNNIQEKKT